MNTSRRQTGFFTNSGEMIHEGDFLCETVSQLTWNKQIEDKPSHVEIYSMICTVVAFLEYERIFAMKRPWVKSAFRNDLSNLNKCNYWGSDAPNKYWCRNIEIFGNIYDNDAKAIFEAKDQEAIKLNQQAQEKRKLVSIKPEILTEKKSIWSILFQ